MVLKAGTFLKACLFLIILVFSTSGKAQYDVTGLDLDGDITDWFDEAIGLDHTRLVSGSYQQIYRSSRGTHQFFRNDLWAPAEIDYYGQRFTGLHMLYDLQYDLLLLRHPSNVNFYSQSIQLHQEKITSFTLHGHTFRYYFEKDNPPSVPGFYDELYLGESIGMIVKREKETKVKSGETLPVFEEADRYYIKYQGEYHRIHNKRSILSTLKPYRKQLRSFIRQQNLVVKPGNNDGDMVEFLIYCNGLIQGS